MSERYAVVNVFDDTDKDKVIGWNVIDTEADNRVMSNHTSEAQAQHKARELESRGS